LFAGLAMQGSLIGTTATTTDKIADYSLSISTLHHGITVDKTRTTHR
jgi:hypothetical protein